MTRRHESLIPLTHDHHHALAQTRRLKSAAREGGRELLGQARVFLDFFHKDTVSHFRDEEELVFPTAVEDERAKPLLSRVMLEHLQIHALASRLAIEVGDWSVTPQSAAALAIALETHIRFEEKELFPLLEEVVGDEKLGAISLRHRERPAVPA